MKTKYSEAFIEQALAKLYSRGERTVQSVAAELNVNHHTLKNWMQGKSVVKRSGTIAGEKRPQDWRAEEQLVALQESHGLAGEALQAWCRERGLFVHHLRDWKAAFCAEGKVPGVREIRALKDENAQLKREVTIPRQSRGLSFCEPLKAAKRGR